MSQPQTDKIRQLNDDFRRTLHGGRTVLTSGVDDLDPALRARAIVETRTFSAFTEGDDPYAEHDFGKFDLDGQAFFWKIDYYDKAMECGSEDPSDPSQTTRVLTIMLANEY